MRLFLILLYLLFTSLPAFSEDTEHLLVLISQHNAETVADAAAQFYKKYRSRSSFQIKASSDRRLGELNDTALSQLIYNRHAIIGIGLYGSSVAKVQTGLDAQSDKRVLIFNSDHRLVLSCHCFVYSLWS